MANFSGGYILTAKGEALQAPVEAGELELNLTKIKIGSGTVASIQDYYNRTDLIQPQNSIVITSKETSTVGEQNACILTASLTNNAVESSYVASEIGLFALDSSRDEVLFAVGYDTNPSFIPDKNTGTEITMTFRFMLLVTTADKVTLTLPTTAEELVTLVQEKVAAAIDSAASASASAITVSAAVANAQAAATAAENSASLATTQTSNATAAAASAANAQTAAESARDSAVSSANAAGSSATEAAASASSANESATSGNYPGRKRHQQCSLSGGKPNGC